MVLPDKAAVVDALRRTLRAELEAYRWARGAYPPALTALRGRNGHRLATVPLDQYSYARSGTGYRLQRLAP